MTQEASEGGVAIEADSFGRAGAYSGPRPKILFRPFESAEPVAPLLQRLRHPIFSFLRMRPIIAQHTRAEHECLLRWARGRRQVVEIGVAEGASACALREAMSPDGALYLIDPFHLSRMRSINALRRAAHSAVGRHGTCKVAWIEDFSQRVAADWSQPIDLLFVDGDHDEAAVLRDWSDWSPHITPRGVALFHDSRVFEKGWTTEEYGPVRVVNRLFRLGGAAGWTIAEEVDSVVVVMRSK